MGAFDDLEAHARFEAEAKQARWNRTCRPAVERVARCLKPHAESYIGVANEFCAASNWQISEKSYGAHWNAIFGPLGNLTLKLRKDERHTCEVTLSCTPTRIGSVILFCSYGAYITATAWGSGGAAPRSLCHHKFSGVSTARLASAFREMYASERNR